MLEIAYLLTFFISCGYALMAYIFSFFLNQAISPLPYGILLVCIVLFYFFGKTGGYRTTSTSFKSTFYKTLFLIFLPGVFLSVLFDAERALPSLSTATPYLIVFLASGIFLLQLLRHSSGTVDHKRFERFQKIQGLSFFLMAFVGTVFNVFEWIMHILNLVIFRPISYVIIALVSSVSQVVENTDSKIKIFGEDGFVDTLQTIQKENGYPSIEDIIAENTAPSNKGDTPEIPSLTKILTIASLCVTILVLLVLSILIIKGLKKERRKNLLIEETREESIEDYVAAKRLKKHFAPPDIQIRFYYKKFMQKARSEKVHLSVSDTTQDISGKYLCIQKSKRNSLEKTSEQMESASALTDIYRKTRYGHKAVNKEDVSAMKKFLRNC